MSKQYTPGPWSTTTNARTSRVYVHNAAMPNGTGMVAEMLACESLEPVHANANLIAAAPDLLEALQWLREMASYAVDHLDEDWARRGGAGDTNRKDLRGALSQADAAIAKACGEGER